jgi:hypothetical protein
MDALAPFDEDRLSDLQRESDAGLRASTVWTPDVFWSFVNGIGHTQTKIVKALLENPAGITSSRLAQMLKIRDEMSLAGVLSGLSKHLKKLELKPAHLYIVNTIWTTEGNKIREFVVHRAFELTAEELNWLEAERKKEDASSTKTSK